MKLLLYADLQATDGSEVCFHDPTIRLQDWRVRKFFSILREIYIANNCDGLIDLGDTTDDRSAIPVPTIDSLITHLNDDFNGWNVKLIGNHEQYTRDARVHAGKLFEHRFVIVESVSTFKVPDSDTHIVFAAYPGDYKELTEQIEKATVDFKGKPLVLFGHFQVIGAQLNSGLAYDGLSKDYLMPFKAGLLGHVHKPQHVGGNVHYVGSPFQQNFGESGEAKRVAIFDTSTLEITWVPLTDYGFPIYRTVTAQEFVELAREDSEDRFHVLLSSQQDTELLFSHPLCNRAETEYSYTINESSPSTAIKSWSFESVLKRYIEKNPPANVGIDVPDDEMLAIGVEISNGAN